MELFPTLPPFFVGRVIWKSLIFYFKFPSYLSIYVLDVFIQPVFAINVIAYSVKV